MILDESLYNNEDYNVLVGNHQLGGTRIGTNEIDSVVDKNLKVHNKNNLFINGSSIFRTGGHSHPTYTIVNSYEGNLPIHHVDLYRLEFPQSLETIDENDLFCFDGITLIEWPQMILPWLDEEETLFIHLMQNPDTVLNCKLKAKGNFYASLFQLLTK